MSGAKRKVFGAEFKAKVGLEAIHGVKTINQIAQDHGVHSAQVGQWKKEILKRAGSLFKASVAPRRSTSTASRSAFTARSAS